MRDSCAQNADDQVARIASRILGRDNEEVDDLVQDVFAEAATGLARLRDTSAGSLKGWLATVTVRVATRRLRARRLRRSAPVPNARISLVVPPRVRRTWNRANLFTTLAQPGRAHNRRAGRDVSRPVMAHRPVSHPLSAAEP